MNKTYILPFRLFFMPSTPPTFNKIKPSPPPEWARKPSSQLEPIHPVKGLRPEEQDALTRAYEKSVSLSEIAKAADRSSTKLQDACISPGMLNWVTNFNSPATAKCQKDVEEALGKDETKIFISSFKAFYASAKAKK